MEIVRLPPPTEITEFEKSLGQKLYVKERSSLWTNKGIARWYASFEHTWLPSGVYGLYGFVGDGDTPDKALIDLAKQIGAFSEIEIEVVVIDGCEYFIYCPGSSGGMMTHKGNCSNPIHKK